MREAHNLHELVREDCVCISAYTPQRKVWTQGWKRRIYDECRCLPMDGWNQTVPPKPFSSFLRNIVNIFLSRQCPTSIYYYLELFTFLLGGEFFLGRLPDHLFYPAKPMLVVVPIIHLYSFLFQKDLLPGLEKGA